MELKYMGKANPQRDHIADVGLPTIGGISQAMTGNENMSLKMRYKVCK